MRILGKLSVGLVATLALAAMTAPTASGANSPPDHWYTSQDGGAHQFLLTPQSDPEAWEAAADDTAALIEALQVPAGELREMSTSALLETVLDFPFLVNYVAFNTPQQGVDAVRDQLNVLDEFLNRADAAETLLSLYERSDLERIAITEDSSTIQIEFLELLLAQPVILDSLGEEGRERAVDAILERSVLKQTLFESDFYGESASTLVTMRALALDSDAFANLAETTEGLSEYLETGLSGELPDEAWRAVRQEVTDELTSSYSLATDIAVDSDGSQVSDGALALDGVIEPLATYNTTVRTPRGSAVAALVITDQWTSAQMAQINLDIQRSYPSVTRLRQPSKAYNCHAYAWHRQAATSNVWINNPSLYMSDGSYIPVAGSSYVNTIPSGGNVSGRKVNYVSGAHSAIVYGNGYFDSKWGQAGLYRHLPRATPYTSTTALRYYR